MIKAARKQCGYVLVAKASHPGPLFNFNYCGGVPPGKVVKIQLKRFSTVLTGNDKNCTLNRVGMFRVQNQLIRSRFFTLPALVVLGSEKSSKFDQHIFPP